MKKLLTFLLLLLLCFNWYGYRWLVTYFQVKNDIALENSFDLNNYQDSQLIEIKVPLQLAYQIGSNAYERCDGEVEYKGVFYKYVKRKVAKDTLYLLCLANTQKSSLETAKSDFFKINNDLSKQDNKKQNSKGFSLKNILSDFEDTHYVSTMHLMAGLSPTIYSILPDCIISDPFIKFTEQPPDFI